MAVAEREQAVTRTWRTAILGSESDRQTHVVMVPERARAGWWTLLVPSAGWVVLGVVVLRSDAASVDVVGAAALLGVVSETLRATVATRGWWRMWHVIFALLLLVTGVVALVDQRDAFVSLVIGFVFVYAGIFDVTRSLFSIGTAPLRWLRLGSGSAQLVLGLLASCSVEAEAAVLLTYVGLSAMSRGAAETSAALTLRVHHPQDG